MSYNLPHINIQKDRLLRSVLDVSIDEYLKWPTIVQELAVNLSAEFFILLCNPFVHPEIVKKSVYRQLEDKRSSISVPLFQLLKQKLDHFWLDYRNLQRLKDSIKKRFSKLLSEDSYVDSPHALVQCSTDATGLLMELPLMVLYPEDTEEIKKIVKAAKELGFYIVPRGGGSGLTGGAVPASRKSVILSLSRLKEIISVDQDQKVLHAQSGVITLDAIQAAAEKGLILAVDPASKSACSLGGNVAENAGGPYAFEYGTTLDSILSYKMVRPNGEVIEIKRKNHPRHKIYPEEKVEFMVLDEHGNLKETVSLEGKEIRKPGLGKDVTNKFLGGLPGIQKEGVDGIITEVSFILHPVLKYSRTLCLEFYGPSMHNATLVIEDLVRLRNKIRETSDAVTMSALEEFGNKYVRAIDYQKKSQQLEGDPNSVLLVQLDSNRKRVLEDTVWTIVNIAENYELVDIFVAEDEKEAKEFWEDRHKLGAIARKTNGFKINEDVVLPLKSIPAFTNFIEYLNRYYLALAYSRALDRVLELKGINQADEFIQMEKEVSSAIRQGDSHYKSITEEEFGLQIHFFFKDLKSRYPDLEKSLLEIEDYLFNFRIEVANHMHAGDGNCHVNIPVHANNQEMLRLTEETISKIFKKVLELNGEVSGEHGIGITKIKYLSEEKIQALNQYKSEIDPDNIINPQKLQTSDLSKAPFTISWARLLEDIRNSSIPNKESLIRQLKHIQICTLCGKCKQVCPMYYPEKGFLFHPRNKNIVLGAMFSALCYNQLTANIMDPYVLSQLQELMEYCTACGKCMSVCPVKIDSADVTINLRSYLDSEGMGGHPWKNKMLNFLAREPERISWAVKAAAWGQNLQNQAIKFIPSFWRRRIQNPIFRGPGPNIHFKDLHELLNLSQSNIFYPSPEKRFKDSIGVLYFPGCGSSLFYPQIAISGINLLLQSGFTVVVPDEHKCCGYPLLSSGCNETYEQLKQNNSEYLSNLVHLAEDRGMDIRYLATSCGTCRSSLEKYDLRKIKKGGLELVDIMQLLVKSAGELKTKPSPFNKLVYHSSCHGAMTKVAQGNADEKYAELLEDILDTDIAISPHCCAESGLGALTAPAVYNKLRKRKQDVLSKYIESENYRDPILVSCPSCKIGLTRIMRILKKKNKVLHTLEYIDKELNRSEFDDLKNHRKIYA